jgi:Glycosyltransferase
MNVLEIANYNAPYAGNFILSLLNVANHLENEEVVFLLPNASKSRNYVKNLKTVYFFSNNIISDALLIQKIIQKHKINIAHSHFPSSKNSLSLKLAVYFCKNVHCIQHIHSEYNSTNGLKKIVRIFLRSHVEAFIPCNYPIHDQLLSDGISKNKVITIANAIDFSRLDTFEAIKKDRQPNILMFGSDWYRKGGDIAIKAMMPIPDVTLYIVSSSNPTEIEKYIIKDFGHVPPFVKLLPSRNDVASYYHLADIFISPSRSEGLPYAIIEAMYCKTLVVASDILPQQRILPSEFMFKAEDPSDLTRVITHTLKLNTNENTKCMLRNIALQNYDINNWSAKIIDTYRSIAAKNKAKF